MTIRISPSVKEAMRTRSGGLVMQVVGTDPLLAETALVGARAELMKLRFLRFVSGVVPGRPGPLIWVDAADVPVGLLRQVTSIVQRHLGDAGIEDAELISPTPLRASDPDNFFAVRDAVALRMFPDPPSPIPGRYTPVPEPWLTSAMAWLTRGDRNALVIVNSDGLVRFELPLTEAAEFLLHAQTRGAQQVSLALRGDREPGKVHVVGVQYLLGNLVLAVGGVRGVVATTVAEELVQFAVHYSAECSYEFVDYYEALGAAAQGVPDHDLRLAMYFDEVVHDAHPFQILGPGHVGRLGGLPAGAEALGSGRVKLMFGRLSEWLPGTESREALYGNARRILAQCIVDEAGLGALWQQRWRSDEEGRWVTWKGFSPKPP